MAQLAGKVVVITGASRGIGAAAARLFAEAGAKLGLLARDAAAISALAEETGGMAVACDVAEPGAVTAAISKVEAAFGPIDVLINNAGTIDPIAHIAEADPEAWGRNIDVNLKGVFYGMRAALPGMMKRRAGTIITVSSGAAHNPLEGWSAYCAGKAGAAMLTQVAHVEASGAGVRVMGLSPGTVATEMQVKIKASGINPVSQLDPGVHIPADWPARALLWMCSADADGFRGQEVQLRDEAIRRRVGRRKEARLAGERLIPPAAASRARLGKETCGMESEGAGFGRFHNGEKAALPFGAEEYDERLAGLRDLMELHSLDAVLLTSAPNVAYYAGFLGGGAGGPAALVVTPQESVTIAAAAEAGRPWRRCHGEALSCSGAGRDDFWRAVVHVVGEGRAVGVEADHLTLVQSEKLNAFLKLSRGMDVSPATVQQRMVKSAAEIGLIRAVAEVADVGAAAMCDAIGAGVREIDLAMAGRGAMEAGIARRFPEAEYRGTGALLQSGSNTDGAWNPATARKLQPGDILGLTACPEISGYGAALARTLFLGEPDAASLAVWQAVLAAHEFGIGLLKPGATCAEVAAKLGEFLAGHDLGPYRAAGWGGSAGLSGADGAGEAGLDLAAGNDTVLEPGMALSMGPVLTIPEGRPVAGGYRARDIVVIGEAGAEVLTGFAHGPARNVAG